MVARLIPLWTRSVCIQSCSALSGVCFRYRKLCHFVQMLGSFYINYNNFSPRNIWTHLWSTPNLFQCFCGIICGGTQQNDMLANCLTVNTGLRWLRAAQPQTNGLLYSTGILTNKIFQQLWMCPEEYVWRVRMTFMSRLTKIENTELSPNIDSGKH